MIEYIEFDSHIRDDISNTLRCLQYIDYTSELRQQEFHLLQSEFLAYAPYTSNDNEVEKSPPVSLKTGRTGAEMQNNLGLDAVNHVLDYDGHQLLEPFHIYRLMGTPQDRPDTNQNSLLIRIAIGICLVNCIKIKSKHHACNGTRKQNPEFKVFPE